MSLYRYMATGSLYCCDSESLAQQSWPSTSSQQLSLSLRALSFMWFCSLEEEVATFQMVSLDCRLFSKGWPRLGFLGN